MRTSDRDAGRLQRRPDLLVGGVRGGVAEVLADRVVEHVRVLRHVADRVLERLQRQVADVCPADPHRAARHVVETRHEVGDRGLAGTGRADECDHLARLGSEAHAVQHLAGLAALDAGHGLQARQRDVLGARIGEVDPVELHARGRARNGGGIRLLDHGGGEVEDLEDAVEAHQRGHHVDADVGEPLEGPEQPQQQGGERGEGPDRECAVDREAAADAVDEGRGQSRDQHHHRHEHPRDQGDADAEVADDAGLLGVALVLLVASAEELEQQRTADVEALGHHVAEVGVAVHLPTGQPADLAPHPS